MTTARVFLRTVAEHRREVAALNIELEQLMVNSATFASSSNGISFIDQAKAWLEDLHTLTQQEITLLTETKQEQAIVSLDDFLLNSTKKTSLSKSALFESLMKFQNHIRSRQLTYTHPDEKEKLQPLLDSAASYSRYFCHAPNVANHLQSVVSSVPYGNILSFLSLDDVKCMQQVSFEWKQQVRAYLRQYPDEACKLVAKACVYKKANFAIKDPDFNLIQLFGSEAEYEKFHALLYYVAYTGDCEMLDPLENNTLFARLALYAKEYLTSTWIATDAYTHRLYSSSNKIYAQLIDILKENNTFDIFIAYIYQRLSQTQDLDTTHHKIYLALSVSYYLASELDLTFSYDIDDHSDLKSYDPAYLRGLLDSARPALIIAAGKDQNEQHARGYQQLDQCLRATPSSIGYCESILEYWDTATPAFKIDFLNTVGNLLIEEGTQLSITRQVGFAFANTLDRHGKRALHLINEVEAIHPLLNKHLLQFETHPERVDPRTARLIALCSELWQSADAATKERLAANPDYAEFLPTQDQEVSEDNSENEYDADGLPPGKRKRSGSR